MLEYAHQYYCDVMLHALAKTAERLQQEKYLSLTLQNTEVGRNWIFSESD